MSGSDWVVLVELGNCVYAEEAHVFANGESEVIRKVLLLEDNLVPEGLTEPRDIGRSGEAIKRSRK